MRLIAAGDQHQVLLRHCIDCPCRLRLNGGLRGGLPRQFQLRRLHRSQLQQTLVQLRLGLGESGQRVNAQQQRPGLVVADIQDLDLHLHVRVEVAAQVAVQQFQPAIGHLVGQQATSEADLLVQGQQGGTLHLGVQTEVPFVRHQVAGADAAVSLDAVADRLR